MEIQNPNKQIYHLKVDGHLDEGWKLWFPGLVISPQADGTTDICGALDDQSMLHGLLARIRDLNVVLLQMERLEEQCALYCLNCPAVDS